MRVGSTRAERFSDGVADENRAQPRGIIELSFKRKDAEHEVERLCHLRNAAAIPRPHLRADVVNDLRVRSAFSQRARDSQIEARIIYEDDGVGLCLVNV